MTKSITAFFESQDDARSAVQELVKHNIAAERISLVSGAPDGSSTDEEAGTAPAAGGLASLGLVGLSTFLLPGIGMIVAGGPLAAAAAASTNDDDATHVDTRLHGALRGTGLTKESLQGYTERIMQGRTLVSVDADDEETDLIADVFHRHGGLGLTFRRHVAA